MNLLVLSLAAILSWAPLAQAKPVQDQYVVVLKESAATPVIKLPTRTTNRAKKARDNQPARNKNIKTIQALLANIGIDTKNVKHIYADVLVGFAGKLSPAQVAALRRNPDVEGIYQDNKSTIQFFSPSSAGTHTGYSIGCNVTTAGGPYFGGRSKDTWIWVVDTGIDVYHPDLNVVWFGPYPVSKVGGESYTDGHGHGTHVAGIAAAKFNEIGTTGVSAGAWVVPVKVFANDGSGFASDSIAGLDHIAIHNIANDVVNMSLIVPWGNTCATSTDTVNRAFRDAVTNLGWAGTWVVGAAGNDSDCAGSTQNLPGCINSYRVYTVGSLECDGNPSSFSNWGPTVDWAAVGGSVDSTYRYNGYARASGTSMAAPVVSGIIHARGGAPLSAGTVTACGASYRKARR